MMDSVFHDDVFYEYFRPFRHPETESNCWGGLGLETYGKDLLIAREYPQNFVWTVVDGYKGVWIVPEYHFINRICYLLTELPHNEAPIQFRMCANTTLTNVGLARRITTLRKVLARTQPPVD